MIFDPLIVGIQGRSIIALTPRTKRFYVARTMLKENMQLFPHGSIVELFKFFASSIFLMICNEGQNENFLMSSGGFTVNLIIKAACPILATVCSVGNFQWPLTKDTVVIRIAKRTFAIAIPGLLYNLQFPNLCSKGDIDSLGTLFMRFCHYKDINENDQGIYLFPI